MNPARLAATSLGAAALLAAGSVALSAALLPERVPTHFALDGAADDWSSRVGAVTFMAVLTVALAALFAGLAALVPRIPWDLVNLPDKQRWTELGKQDVVRRRLRTDLCWVGSATVLLVAVGNLAVLAAARSGSGRLPWWAGAVFGVWLLGLLGYALVGTRRRYRAPDQGRTD
ncbi:DUF1648 domain-containing protein [Kineococcus gynurae]|uniref:DUF1648 domain-containing protein n=1 Tax=Kineococcus gynurae TaxID=452979 RepID=A0ABV5LSI8_9ACTN